MVWGGLHGLGVSRRRLTDLLPALLLLMCMTNEDWLQLQQANNCKKPGHALLDHNQASMCQNVHISIVICDPSLVQWSAANS